MIKSIVRGSLASLFAFTLAISVAHAASPAVITGTDPQPSNPNPPTGNGPKSAVVTSSSATSSASEMVSLLLSLFVS